MLRTTVEALAAEERARQHNALADRLTRALTANGHAGHSDVPSPSVSGREFISESVPRRRLEELTLAPEAEKQARDLIEEQHRADLLRSHGIQPRHRVLLCGPPGNGKTSLAEAIAEALAVPFFGVRYDALIGSYLGETTQRLRRLFEYIRTVPCVLLFDEFDAIGKERGDAHETGEIKRVVSSLLLQVDSLPSYVVVIAATNHAELLDRAVWRRFEIRLDLPQPNLTELTKFLERSFTRQDISVSPREVARKLGVVSFAEATDFLLDVHRKHVLSLGARGPDDILREHLCLWAARVKAPRNAGGQK